MALYFFLIATTLYYRRNGEHELPNHGFDEINSPLLIFVSMRFKGTISTRIAVRFGFLVLDLRRFCFGMRESLQNKDLSLRADFTDASYFDAGVAGEFIIHANVIKSGKEASALLMLNGEELHSSRSSEAAADKIRKFISDLRDLEKFAIGKFIGETLAAPVAA
jgi:hypothetical protein